MVQGHEAYRLASRELTHGWGAGGDALGQLLVGHWLMHAALERLWPALPPLQGLVVPDGQELQQALRC